MKKFDYRSEKADKNLFTIIDSYGGSNPTGSNPTGSNPS